MATSSNAKTLKNLREMGKHVEDAAKQALKRGTDRVVEDAKRRVPVRTGKLRDSIKATANRSGTTYTITANADNRGYRYGRRLEYDPKLASKRFLHPALDAHRQQIYDDIKNSASQAIRGR